MADLHVWRQMTGPAFDALRAQASEADPTDVAAVARLRKLAPAEIVSAALELADARRRLQAKWPDRWEWMLADRAGAEMASSRVAAKHKAARFAQRFRGGEVADLCCGIGADAIGLMEAGLKVTGYDVDPARCWMCAVNAQCDAKLADVTSEPLGDVPFHLDPARRSVGAAPGARGRWAMADHAPSPDFWRKLAAAGRPGAVKLGPGVDRDQVAAVLGEPGRASAPRFEIEYISESGKMTQAVVWLGALAEQEPVSATLLEDGRVFRMAGRPGDPPPPVDEESAFVLEADPSVERARLLGRLCNEHGLHELHPGLRLLTGPAAVISPWLTSFRVLDRAHFNVRRLKDVLRELGAGVVEAKTRGGACDTDQVQAQLRGHGSRLLTVFVLRLTDSVWSLVCERVVRSPGK